MELEQEIKNGGLAKVLGHHTESHFSLVSLWVRGLRIVLVCYFVCYTTTSQHALWSWAGGAGGPPLQLDHTPLFWSLVFR